MILITSKWQKKYSGRPFAVAWKKISSYFLHRRFKWRYFERSRCDFESYRWREYFSDLLNPVDATSTQIHEEPVEKMLRQPKQM